MAPQHHIIVADDDPLFLFLLQQALAIYCPSASVTAVPSAEEALGAFSQRGADLIVTDCHMPMMSGIELVAALRTRETPPPIVVLSSDWEMEQEALETGAALFILKGGALEATMYRLIALLTDPVVRR